MPQPQPIEDDNTQPLYTWAHFHADVRDIIEQIKAAEITITGIYAVPRGGLVLGTMLAHAFTVPLYIGHEPLPSTNTSVLAVDDNTITGGSLAPFAHHGMPCAVLVKHPNAPGIGPFFAARESDEVFLFPWEVEAAHDPIRLYDVIAPPAYYEDYNTDAANEE